MNILLRVSNYISRYAPSEQRIRTYLTKKWCRDIDTLLREIGYDESLMCDLWMRTFLTTAKGKREIIQKLTKKEFTRELILAKVESNLQDIMNWDECRHAVTDQIRTLFARSKSRQVVMMTLVGKYPYFRDEIRELIEWMSDADGLSREFDKYLARYDIHDHWQKQKFYAALLRKGFTYDQIQRKIKEWPEY